MDAWVAAVCFNTVEGKKYNLVAPKSWKDLTKPMYKGHVIMPNPNSSGTGYLDVSSWLQIFGEDGGWDYMDALHQNIARYTHSGSKAVQIGGLRRNSHRRFLCVPWCQIQRSGRAHRNHYSKRRNRLGNGSQSAIIAGTDKLRSG